ncbi:hypothetical protein V7x_54120 [Crateriforma conspicua]|uniref:Uncharacterized protein n=1 Tax=Crateriforma conspicua TaxID=2527996 RepID=A0A5C6FJZ0_9PLAN|nr:hypothetical protein V7x_54120 [Crateriforma conspicua]
MQSQANGIVYHDRYGCGERSSSRATRMGSMPDLIASADNHAITNDHAQDLTRWN